MRRMMGFLLPLIVVITGIAAGAAWVIDRASSVWFEKDLRMRAELVVHGAHEALVQNWHESRSKRLRKVLSDIQRDARIVSATACLPNFHTLAETVDYPEALACSQVGELLGSLEPSTGTVTRVGVFPLNDTRVHLSLVPVLEDDKSLGAVVLAHDLSFADRRGELARMFLYVMVATLALVALGLVAWVARFSWRQWTLELLGFLRGKPPGREFRPFLSDVRELMQRLAIEDDSQDERGISWNAQKLKRVLTTQLAQERVLVVANREPYIHQYSDDGTTHVTHPASGLVTALEPVMRACSGVWVAHGSGSADKANTKKDGTVSVPPDDPSYTLKRVWLTKPEEKGYYYGFANEGLWPLCHVAHVRPLFRSDDFAHYRAVNEKFALATIEEADSDEPIILVQDYHFTLLPRMLRQRLPRATVVTFFHIPWPSAERLGMCPWFEEILQGLLGSSILSFHTQAHCNNFIEAVDRYLEARIDREQQAIVFQGRTTLVRSYPISLEWPPSWLAAIPSVDDCRSEIVARHRLPKDVKIGIGVDRIDYTKGIEERLLAVERLLEQHPELQGKFVFIQLGAPSRTAIQQYRLLNEVVEATAARINDRFGADGYQPILFLRDHHEPDSVYRYYRAADVCYVSSLHDGMNLVAKEFVAARNDNLGVLVLSRFTGAAKELTTALLVNPYDLDGAAEALHLAVTMSEGEQMERMIAMRTLIAEFNVYRWAGKMLVDANKARQSERLRGRLALSLVPVPKALTRDRDR